MGANRLTPEEIRHWFLNASDTELNELLDEGLEELISDLEDEDFFGTEGFNRRYG